MLTDFHKDVETDMIRWLVLDPCSGKNMSAMKIVIYGVPVEPR